jgi:ATP phosphoribosyltransferase
MLSTELPVLRLGLPKGRMQEGVFRLLGDAGLPVHADERGYRPSVGSPGAGADGFLLDSKILKPQNIIEMIDLGSRDFGFAGADWVRELGADIVELLDTRLDPVRVVAAAPTAILEGGRLPKQGAGGRRLLVASEYQNIAMAWIDGSLPGAQFVRSYGATEVFPPEDADVIVDNAASGSTLRANGLTIVEEIMTSSTRLYASREAMDDPVRRAVIETVALLTKSVLEARGRVMLEINVPADKLERLAASIPCLRAPTISALHGGTAYAVKVAAPRSSLASLIPEIKRLGGEDIVVTELAQLVP